MSDPTVEEIRDFWAKRTESVLEFQRRIDALLLERHGAEDLAVAVIWRRVTWWPHHSGLAQEPLYVGPNGVSKGTAAQLVEEKIAEKCIGGIRLTELAFRARALYVPVALEVMAAMEAEAKAEEEARAALKALGLRFMATKIWQLGEDEGRPWVDGMLFVSDGAGGLPRTEAGMEFRISGEGDYEDAVAERQLCGDHYPVMSDPATRGVVLELVRKKWGPDAHLVRRATNVFTEDRKDNVPALWWALAVGPVSTPLEQHDGDGHTYFISAATEAETLIYALEADPCT